MITGVGMGGGGAYGNLATGAFRQREPQFQSHAQGHPLRAPIPALGPSRTFLHVFTPEQGTQERASGSHPAWGVSGGTQDGVVTLGGVKSRRGGGGVVPVPAWGWGLRVGT